MALPLNARPGLFRAIQEGINATDALGIFREAGGAIRTADFYRLYGQVEAEIAAGLIEPSRPLNRRPSAQETETMTTKGARGYIQRVTIYQRDRDSGEIISRPYSYRTDALRSRASVISSAITDFADNADKYGMTTVGAAYNATFELSPE